MKFSTTAVHVIKMIYVEKVSQAGGLQKKVRTQTIFLVIECITCVIMN